MTKDKIKKQMIRDPIFLEGAEWHPMNKAIKKVLKDVERAEAKDKD